VTQPIYAEGATEPDCVPAPLAASTSGWICEHRQRHVASMVAFRRDAGTAPVSHSWNNGQNQLAFAREGRGFVAINHELVALEQTLQTGLPEGDYCDVLSGDFKAPQGDEPAACSGTTVSVDTAGSAVLVVAPETAVALHLSARL
jgi:alpha-amylase